MEKREIDEAMYDVSGFYVSNSEIQIFNADFFCVPRESKLVGLIYEPESSLYKSKPVLGLFDKDNLQFWKMSLTSDDYPTIYNLKGDLDNGFSGYYDRFDNLDEYAEILEYLPEIRKTTTLNSDREKISLLDRIGFMRFNYFFGNNLMNAVYKNGEKKGNQIEFNMHKL